MFAVKRSYEANAALLQDINVRNDPERAYPAIDEAAVAVKPCP